VETCRACGNANESVWEGICGDCYDAQLDAREHDHALDAEDEKTDQAAQAAEDRDLTETGLLAR
jgi:hypothetical protein